jgi:23S rRNA pseudouridine2605 synthase
MAKKNFRDKKNTGAFGQKEIRRTVTKGQLEEAMDSEDVIGMRLNKFVAHCGVASRRNAADMVKSGKIMVNDEVVTEPFYQIKENDVVKLDGKVINPESKKVYLLLNKPKNVITTTSDEKGRTTVMEIIGEKVAERIFPVGRLDRDTTGLLLLTNDGDLAQKLAHPSHKIQKVYLVTLDKNVSPEHLDAISKGLKLDDGLAPVDKVGYNKPDSKNEVLIEIHIGRNRIVRRIFETLGYEVKKLDRLYYAGLTKKELPRGQFRFLTDREVTMLKHFV